MTRLNNALAALGVSGALLGPVAAETPIVREDFRVTTADGVGIRVREVAPAGGGNGEPIILIHGARVPGIASFDLDVQHGSLAADLATRLQRRVFIMDARGYGGSDRAAAMAKPPQESRPLSRAHEVVRDVAAVVDAALQRAGTRQVALFGWATGGMWASYYASLWPERVGHLVAFNALYGGSDRHPTLGPGSRNADPAAPDRLARSVGGYALNNGASLTPSWDSSIPDADKSKWRDPAIVDAYTKAALASDPQSQNVTPSAFRAPLGAIEDSFYQAAGRRLFDAGSITASVLVLRSSRDFWSRPEDMDAFVHDAMRARSVRAVILPDATHYAHLDRPEYGRDRLLKEVVEFLSKDQTE